jgi:predicted methyltransferase
MMNNLACAVALTLVTLAPSLAAAQSDIDAILADQSRPDTDRARDEASQPASVLAFFDAEAGDQVADLLAGSGYYTRILVPLVGAGGKVYSGNNPFYRRFFGEDFDNLLAEPAFGAVIRVDGPVDALPLPGNASLDLVLISQAYHDLVLGDEDRNEMNRIVFAALKPGGVYGIVDHAAVPGSGTTATESLHRIDKQVVVTEVEAAGFRLADEADFLANADDDLSASVFAPSIQGKTHRFVLRFEKPL